MVVSFKPKIRSTSLKMVTVHSGGKRTGTRSRLGAALDTNARTKYSERGLARAVTVVYVINRRGGMPPAPECSNDA